MQKKENQNRVLTVICVSNEEIREKRMIESETWSRFWNGVSESRFVKKNESQSGVLFTKLA